MNDEEEVFGEEDTFKIDGADDLDVPLEELGEDFGLDEEDPDKDH